MGNLGLGMILMATGRQEVLSKASFTSPQAPLWGKEGFLPAGLWGEPPWAALGAGSPAQRPGEDVLLGELLRVLGLGAQGEVGEHEHCGGEGGREGVGGCPDSRGPARPPPPPAPPPRG